MEVFGTVAGAVNCADAAWRVYNSLSSFIQQARNADSTAKYLQDKVNNLRDLLLNVKNTLPDSEGTHMIKEARQIQEQILKAVNRCQETLKTFGGDLDRLNGQDRFEILRKALLARKLRKLDPALSRFEGELETNWKAISILFLCLQAFVNNANTRMLCELQSGIHDGKTYLQEQKEQSQEESKTFSPPIRTTTSFSKATTAIAEDDEFIETEHEKEQKRERLESLNDSINVATEVFNQMSRPGSFRESVITTPNVDEKPMARMSDTESSSRFARSIEVLDRLVENFMNEVGEALRNGDYKIAEKHQISLIQRLEERRNAYDVRFDEYTAQGKLAEIYFQQGRLQEHNEIHNRLIEIKMEPQNELQQLDRHSRSYKCLASSRFKQYQASKAADLLIEASAMAQCSVKLRRGLVQVPEEPDPLFQDAVRLLVKILQEQGENVEAETYRQLYLSQMEVKPPSPPLTPRDSMSMRKFSSTEPPIDLNACDENGVTHLVHAIEKREIGRIQYLLENKVDAERVCKGMRPLMHAVCCHLPAAVVLLHHYRPALELDECDEDGRTALMLAAERGDVEMIQVLVDLGASVGILSNDGRSPLMRAAKNDHKSVVEILISKDNDCSRTDSVGWNALHYAVHGKGGEEVIQLLIGAGISVDSRCDNGETALHIAVNLKRQEILEALLAYKADFKLVDGVGYTPVSVAVENDYREGAELLFERGAIYDRCPPSSLHRKTRKLLKDYNQPPSQPRRDSASTTTSRRWAFSRPPSRRNSQR